MQKMVRGNQYPNGTQRLVLVLPDREVTIALGPATLGHSLWGPDLGRDLASYGPVVLPILTALGLSGPQAMDYAERFADDWLRPAVASRFGITADELGTWILREELKRLPSKPKQLPPE